MHIGIDKIEDVKKYIDENYVESPFESNPTEWKDSKVYKRAMITKQTFSKIRNETNYHPDKETAVKMCFGLKLNIDETVDLLAKAGYTLSMSIKQDLIIRYFIEHKAYDVIDLNNMFYSFNLPYYKT